MSEISLFFSHLNKLSLTLLKLAQPLMDNTSIRGLRKEFSWDLEECLSVLLNAFDENTLRSAFENAKKSRGIWLGYEFY